MRVTLFPRKIMARTNIIGMILKTEDEELKDIKELFNDADDLVVDKVEFKN